MPVKEQDKREFKLKSLRDQLQVLKKSQERTVAFERLSVNQDFKCLKELLDGQLAMAEADIVEYNLTLNKSFLTDEQERAILKRLRHENARVDAITEILQWVQSTDKTLPLLESEIKECEEKINKLEEQDNARRSE